jgi:hypothetical protein
MYASGFRFRVAGRTPDRIANQDPDAIYSYPTLAHPRSEPHLWPQHAVGLPPHPAHREIVAFRNIFVSGVPLADVHYE